MRWSYDCLKTQEMYFKKYLKAQGFKKPARKEIKQIVYEINCFASDIKSIYNNVKPIMDVISRMNEIINRIDDLLEVSSEIEKGVLFNLDNEPISANIMKLNAIVKMLMLDGYDTTVNSCCAFEILLFGSEKLNLFKSIVVRETELTDIELITVYEMYEYLDRCHYRALFSHEVIKVFNRLKRINTTPLYYNDFKWKEN